MMTMVGDDDDNIGFGDNGGVDVGEYDDDDIIWSPPEASSPVWGPFTVTHSLFHPSWADPILSFSFLSPSASDNKDKDQTETEDNEDDENKDKKEKMMTNSGKIKRTKMKTTIKAIAP